MCVSVFVMLEMKGASCGRALKSEQLVQIGNREWFSKTGVVSSNCAVEFSLGGGGWAPHTDMEPGGLCFGVGTRN